MDLSAPLLEKYWPFFAAVVLGVVIAEVVRSFFKTKPTAGFTVDVDPVDKEEQLPRDPLDVCITGDPVVKYVAYPYFDEIPMEEEMKKKSLQFYDAMSKRRTVRKISSDSVPLEVIENIVKVAGTAPSGANSEPWTFVVVSDPTLKKQIHNAVEEEEQKNYARRIGESVENLNMVKTNWAKPYITEAPYLILIFHQVYGYDSSGRKKPNYYSEMSVCVACGLLIAAIQNVGLVTVTSTPMNAGPRLRQVLNRPDNEKLLMLLPVGYPASDAEIPDLTRKPLGEIMVLK